MTPERFREIRTALRMTADEMAATLRLEGGRAIRRYEAGDRAIPGPVAALMDVLAALHVRPAD